MSMSPTKRRSNAVRPQLRPIQGAARQGALSINGAGIMGAQPIRIGSPKKINKGPVRPVHGIGSEEAFGENPMSF